MTADCPAPQASEDLLAQAALPSFGFFGGTAANALQLEVCSEVDEIVLWIDDTKGEILNLGEIRFLSPQGEPLDRRDLCAGIDVSSVYKDRSVADFEAAFFEGRMLHSARDPNPRLRIAMKAPTLVGKVIIFNRNDVWGMRSRFLCAEAWLQGKKVFSWHNMSSARRSEIFSALVDGLTASPEPGCRVFQTEISKIQAEMCRALASLILSGRANEGIDWNHAILAVRFFKERQDLSDDEVVILSYYTLTLMGQRFSIGTSTLAPFGRALYRKGAVDHFMKRLNDLRVLYKISDLPFIISKHQINASVLLSRKDKYLMELDRVIQLMVGWGCDAMLCYGSLLGAVRSGEFIPHDDDVDVLYLDGSTSQQQACDRAVALMSRFQENGYTCWPTKGSPNIHVSRNGVAIDLFPCWSDADQVHLLMEGMRFRPIAASLITPPGSTQLYEMSFPAPADKAGFLTERYGPNWGTPDPYFEWPWKLID